MKVKRVFVNREEWIQELVKKEEMAKLERWLLEMRIILQPSQFEHIPLVSILR